MLDADDRYAPARNQMIEHQIAARGIVDPAVLGAMRTVPREHFVSPGFADRAYDDRPLPIERGQTISQPFIVAQMAAAAELTSTDRVLEIGTGSGYGAAVLSQIADRVWSIERHHSLAATAQERLAQLGYDNVQVLVGDGSLGWPAAAPFDAIVVTAAAPSLPRPFLNQLVEGGRLIIPLEIDAGAGAGAGAGAQKLRRIRRQRDQWVTDDLGAVRFVPLIGEAGFSAPT